MNYVNKLANSLGSSLHSCYNVDYIFSMFCRKILGRRSKDHVPVTLPNSVRDCKINELFNMEAIAYVNSKDESIIEQGIDAIYPDEVVFKNTLYLITVRSGWLYLKDWNQKSFVVFVGCVQNGIGLVRIINCGTIYGFENLGL